MEQEHCWQEWVRYYLATGQIKQVRARPIAPPRPTAADTTAPAAKIINVTPGVGRTATSIAIVDRGIYRFLLAGRSIIGAHWSPPTPTSRRRPPATELVFPALSLQTLGLYVSQCVRIRLFLIIRHIP